MSCYNTLKAAESYTHTHTHTHTSKPVRGIARIFRAIIVPVFCSILFFSPMSAWAIACPAATSGWIASPSAGSCALCTQTKSVTGCSGTITQKAMATSYNNCAICTPCKPISNNRAPWSLPDWQQERFASLFDAIPGLIPSAYAADVCTGQCSNDCGCTVGSCERDCGWNPSDVTNNLTPNASNIKTGTGVNITCPACAAGQTPNVAQTACVACHKVTLNHNGGTGASYDTLYFAPNKPNASISYNTQKANYWYNNSTCTAEFGNSQQGPSRAGYKLTGYYTATSGGSQVIYAFTQIMCGANNAACGDPRVPSTYALRTTRGIMTWLYHTGYICTQTTASIKNCTKDHYYIDFSPTGASDGSPYTSISSDITVYARWQAESCSAGQEFLGPACANCKAGYFKAGTGTAACTACAQGSRANASTGSTGCTACGAGTTTSGTGTSSTGTCSNCTTVTGMVSGSWLTPSWTNNSVSNLCAVNQCQANRFKSGSGTSATCPQCPPFGSASNLALNGNWSGNTPNGSTAIRGTSAAGSTSQTSCCIPTTQTFTDGTGTWKFESNKCFPSCAWGYDASTETCSGSPTGQT